MINSIDPVPEFPLALRSAAVRKALVPFIGAGVSRLGGCPSWDQLADRLFEVLCQKGQVNYAQIDQLHTLPARTRISIAIEVARQANEIVDYASLLEPQPHKTKVGDRIYKAISMLASTFITTNYDDWLDRPRQGTTVGLDGTLESVRPRIFCKKEELTLANLGVENAVFHIHGSITIPETMVLTTLQYLKLYSGHRLDGKETDRENQFLTFLQKVFELRSILFVGYGFAELELLEYVFEKGLGRQQDKSQSPRHYILQGYFNHELELARNMEKYFAEFGVGLLPFSKDGRDHEQLCEVIEKFVQETPAASATELATRREMEGLLS